MRKERFLTKKEGAIQKNNKKPLIMIDNIS